MKLFRPFGLVAAALISMTACSPQLKLGAPSSNGIVQTLEPTFRWEFANKEELTYELKISESSKFEGEVKYFKIPQASFFTLTIPFLKPGKKYFWAVRATYLDSKTRSYVVTNWATKDKEGLVPYSFSTSATAKGDDRFEEGQKEEVIIKDIVANISRITMSPDNEWSPAVSKDGQKIAFVSDRTKNKEIFVKNLTSGGAGEIQRTFSAADQDNLNPFWLPDNENFGFYTNRLDKKNWQLFSSTKGKGLTLISTSGSFTSPEYLFGAASNNNSNILYTAITKYNSRATLWLFDAELNRFTQLVQGMFPDINGNDIVYTLDKNGDGDYNLWSMELEDNTVYRETQLTFFDGWDFDPAISPDGKRIAYASHQSGNSDIWIINMDGTNQTQVTFHTLADRRPQWVDNQTLIFQSNRELDKKGNPSWDIWQVKVPEANY